MAKFNRLLINNVHVTGNLNSTKTILFSHGFGTTQEVWHEIAQSFQDDCRIVLYDIVGCRPESEAAFSPNLYDCLSAYVDDLLEICDTADLKNVIFVGHSLSGMSGMIGCVAAVRRPDLFSRLVLIAASACYLDRPGYKGGFSQQDLDNMFQFMRTNYFAWASGFGPAAMGNPDRPMLGENFGRTLQAIRPDIALSVLKVFMESDIRDDLQRLDRPTLIIQSHDDIAVPLEAAQFLHKQIRESRLALINASGHLPHISAAGEIIAAIKSFI